MSISRNAFRSGILILILIQMVHHHNPSFRRKRQIINGQGHAALNTATPIRQRNGACSTELRQGQVNCIVPDYHPTILEVQVCALGFSEKDKNIRRRRAINLLGKFSSRACWSGIPHVS